MAWQSLSTKRMMNIQPKTIPSSTFASFQGRLSSNVFAETRTRWLHRQPWCEPVSRRRLDFPHTCDVEMWMRFATQSAIGVINAPQAYYRWHDNNMSSQYIGQPMGDLREQIETCEHVSCAWGQGIPEFPQWIDEMRTRFAAEACWLAGLAIERGDARAAGECLEFAKSLQPDIWKLRSWWIFQIKRAVGARSVAHLRSRTGKGDPRYRPFNHGAQFGWWPGSD